MWKNYNHIDFTDTHWACLPFVLIYLLMGRNSPSLKVSISTMMSNDDTNGADLQCAYAGDVKTIYNCIDITNTHQACLLFADLPVDVEKSPCFDGLYLCNYG